MIANGSGRLALGFVVVIPKRCEWRMRRRIAVGCGVHEKHNACGIKMRRIIRWVLSRDGRHHSVAGDDGKALGGLLSTSQRTDSGTFWRGFFQPFCCVFVNNNNNNNNNIHRVHIKSANKLMAVTSPNLNRFSKFFYHWKEKEIFSKKPMYYFPTHLKYVVALPLRI